MEKLAKVSRYVLASIILYSLITSLISLSVWLDMRIHSRYVVYICFLIMVIFIIKKDFKSIKAIIIGEGLMILVFTLGKFPRVAYELREAFHLPIKINNFNILIICLIIFTSLIVYFDSYNYKNKKAGL